MTDPKDGDGSIAVPGSNDSALFKNIEQFTAKNDLSVSFSHVFPHFINQLAI